MNFRPINDVVKTILLSIILVALTVCANAQISTNQPSRFKTKIIFNEGKIGSGTGGSDLCFVPMFPGDGRSDKVTTPGHESELKWSFVGRNGDKDVYRFTFTHLVKTGSSISTTTSTEVGFDGKQIVVFQDELHSVVMESPSVADLKSAEKRST